jgi:hypothetical protein
MATLVVELAELGGQGANRGDLGLTVRRDLDASWGRPARAMRCCGAGLGRVAGWSPVPGQVQLVQLPAQPVARPGAFGYQALAVVDQQLDLPGRPVVAGGGHVGPAGAVTCRQSSRPDPLLEPAAACPAEQLGVPRVGAVPCSGPAGGQRCRLSVSLRGSTARHAPERELVERAASARHGGREGRRGLASRPRPSWWSGGRTRTRCRCCRGRPWWSAPRPWSSG